MNAYKYRPLDPEAHQIRLLQIQKSSDESLPITVSLRHVSLDDEQHFNALSYTWGDETPTMQVAIHDGETLGFVSVRRNLFEFLKEARQSNEAWSSEWIWIDQISIKQENSKERCHQVGQMRKIYSIAKATLVWPFSWSKSSLEAMQRISAEYQFDLNGLICATPSYKAIMESLFESKGPPDQLGLLLLECTYGHYVQLLTTPYWKRLWIIQELVLASRYYIIVSGQLWQSNRIHELISFVSRLLKLNVHDGKKVAEMDERIRSFDLYQSWNGVDRCLNSQKSKGSKRLVSWGAVLLLSKNADCTRPLDRVYGIMGLLNEDLHILPDYGISETELLRRILYKQLSAFATHRNDTFKSVYTLLRAWSYTGLERSEETHELLRAWSYIGSEHSVATNWELDVKLANRHSRRKMRQVVICALNELDVPIPPPSFKDVTKSIIRNTAVPLYWRAYVV